MQEEYCELLDVSRNTYYVHKRENRPIVALLEKYFTADDLREFLKTGKIARLDINRTIDNQLEEFALKSVVFKIKQTSKQSIDFASKLPLSLFFHILDTPDLKNKNDLLIAIDNINLKLLEHPNYKNIIVDFINDQLSSIEIEQLIKNKDKVKEIVYKKTS